MRALLVALAALAASGCFRAWDTGGPWACSEGLCPQGYTCQPADVGKAATELDDGIALRILRGGRSLGFWEPAARIEAGDRLVVLSPRAAA